MTVKEKLDILKAQLKVVAREKRDLRQILGNRQKALAKWLRKMPENPTRCNRMAANCKKAISNVRARLVEAESRHRKIREEYILTRQKYKSLLKIEEDKNDN